MNKSRKRPTNDENQLREPKHPRIQIDRTDGSTSTMDIDGSNMDSDDSTMEVDCSIVLPPSPSSPSCIQFNVNTTQDDELNEMVDNMELGLEAYDKAVEVTGQVLTVTSTMLGVASDVTKNFAVFAPLISTFLNVGKEIIILYKKAEHHKELCGFLLNRSKCAIVAVRDLNTKKAEHADFFSKQENFDLFVEFVKCMQRIQEFIADVSQLKKFKKYLYANNIEEKFHKLVNEFDGYMSSLNFTFTMQSKDDLTTIKNEIKQIKEILLHYGVSDDKQSQEIFFDRMNLITEKNEEFQRQTRENKNLDDSQFKALEENEPLLDGNKYQKTNICPSKRIVKRTAINSYDEYCFKEFSNNPPFSADQSNNEETQIEIRRQVNILKELKNSDHIIRFYGVAQEESKYYLVTEWMEHGNLHEYYTKFRDSINLKTKIKFALDICRGVAYLHSCEILHRDIQSANILVNGNDKVRIANFGLSRKFHDITRNISHNLENIRYMAPEKLNNDVKKRKAYDSKCEIYSVGALLWEIAELKKPHADLDKSEAIVKIRKRVEEKYRLPFSKDIPFEWIYIVTKAMEYEPAWRYSISEICREFYNLSKKYLTSNLENGTMDKDRKASTVTILPVKDAINEHKSNNGDKQLAWQSFKYHSSTDIEAKYWLGYYYYHEEIPELQEISKEERIRIAADIFKETADKGNPSAQLRYGMCLWKGDGVGQNSIEALKYLESAANSENAAAMYVIGKAYLSGSNGIERDENRGVKYLKEAASRNHDKARKWCNENNIAF